MLRVFAFAALAAVGLLSMNAVAEDAKDAKKDPLAAAKCPMSGEAAKADQNAEFEGGKVYFCCDECKANFAKDSSKGAAKARNQMVLTGQFEQKACPLTGAPTKAETALNVGGVKVAFCCNNCKGKVEKAKDDAPAVVFSDKEKFAKAFTKVEVKNTK